MNPVPLRDRRDYTPFFIERDREFRRDTICLSVTAISVLLALGFVVHVFIAPKTAHATDYTPSRDYPLTNKGSCMLIRDHHRETVGASPEQFKSLCAKEGVTI